MPIRVQTCSITRSVLPPVIQNNYSDIHTLVLFLSICCFIAWQYLPTSFLYDLAFPSSMNLLWAWQCGFLCRRLEYKYGFLRLELLFLLWYKSFQKTTQIGQVATWTALFTSLFLSEEADFIPASFSQTPDVQSTTCTITWLDEEKKKKKTLGDYFSLWNWFLQRMSHCLFPSCKFRKDCTHSCLQPVLPLWIHLISRQHTSLCLHVRITSRSTYFSHCAVWISELLCKAIDEGCFLWVADKALRFQPGRRGSPDTAAYQAGWQSCCLQNHTEQGAEVLW